MPEQMLKTNAAAMQGAASMFMREVYAWMCAGLGLTALTAWFVAETPALRETIFGSAGIVIALIIAEFGLVIALSFMIRKLSPTAATLMFLAYSVLTGATLSSVFLAYSTGEVAGAFISAAGMFGAMSAWGAVTRKDLSGMGSFMFMGLVGIIIASIVNLFIGNSMLDLVISCVGVIVFAGLTAWDTQKLLALGADAPDDAGLVRKGAVLGALSLYLDFINLFLMLLRIFSASRN